MVGLDKMTQMATPRPVSTYAFNSFMLSGLR